jgi:hypothetical protein
LAIARYTLDSHFGSRRGLGTMRSEKAREMRKEVGIAEVEVR